MTRSVTGSLSYVIDYPDLETLIQMIEQIPAFSQLPNAQRAVLRHDLVSAVRDGAVRSMRDAQRFAMRHFVSKLLKRSSLAQHFAA